MNWKQVLICIAVVTAGPVQASADSSDSGCLFDLSTRMAADSQITVATVQNKVFNGRLTSLDLSNQTLTFIHTTLDNAQYTFRADEIQLIRYRQDRKFKAGWAIGGLMLGTLAGLGVGAAASSGSDDEFADFAYLFTVPAGGLLGFILGAWIPAHDKEVTVKCP